MAAGEHHAKQIVFYCARCKEFLNDRGECPFALKKPAQLRRKGACRALAPQDVQCAVLCSGHEPGRRVLRHAANSPHLQRAAEGVLHDVLRQREVVDAKDARQRGDHPPRLAPEEMIAGLHHMFSCMTGRTSTEPPTSRIGQPLEISTACARSLASIRLKPPTRSLASAYGPSVTIFWLPLTTMPALSSGCPSSARWPFAPSSLNHAAHFCSCFCRCSGDADVSLPPRYRYVNSLIVIPPWFGTSNSPTTFEPHRSRHFLKPVGFLPHPSPLVLWTVSSKASVIAREPTGRRSNPEGYGHVLCEIASLRSR